LEAPPKEIKMSGPLTIKIHNYGKIPSKKNRMRVYNNRMIKAQDVRTFETMLANRARQIMSLLKLDPLEGPVKLHLDVTFGDRRRRDLQNLFGSVCDSLNDIVYVDDHQITKLSGSKVYKKGQWEYTITITKLKGESDGPEV
jgi:Holliday junction resolvase RusA-like endonuclease